MRSIAIGAAVAAVAFVVAWRALPWLRSGGHRYADEADRAARRHTWVLSTVPVVAFLIGAAWSEQPVHAIVFASFAVFLILISAIDLDVQRLPDRWTKPAMAAAPLATAVLAGLDRDLDSWVRSLLAALALGAVYFVLVLLGGGSGMGLGDAKLAPSIDAGADGVPVRPSDRGLREGQRPGAHGSGQWGRPPRGDRNA